MTFPKFILLTVSLQLVGWPEWSLTGLDATTTATFMQQVPSIVPLGVFKMTPLILICNYL